MAPADVSDTDVLTIWNKMRGKAGKTQRLSKLKFRVGQHVRISKEKMKFAKVGEQNYTTEIFKVRKLVHRTPRPVFELEDLRGQEIEGLFYSEELVPVRITKHTTYKNTYKYINVLPKFVKGYNAKFIPPRVWHPPT